ncbi:uncharacterized protein B0P05DRAFT_566430, partial [Gilbertella persicaria]|uniref:uncharacterized protein n=1 Tax=Gilbertella persicaria TaxID=101096 RepID=UPI0022208DEF
MYPKKYTILVALILLLLSGIFVQYLILSPNRHTKKYTFQTYNNQIPTRIKNIDLTPPLSSLLSSPPLPSKTVIPEACQGVDFKWLASDRKYWDGWSSKAMFMKKNGKFTRKPVQMNQGESVCVAVLLGPVPALSIIKAMSHYGPADSIMMTAVDTKGTRVPIVLKQHEKQTNSYFASVQFSFSGTWRLETSVEYRSYFWEYPNFHKYLPNRFQSENSLIVRPKQQPVHTCDLLNGSLMNSAWKKSGKKYDFMPPCKLLDNECSSKYKTIHMWGDRHLKRNTLSMLNRIPANSNICGQDEEQQLKSPLTLPNQSQQIYFDQLNKTVVEMLGAWKMHIQNKKRQLPKADLVLIGIGNEDLGSIRQDPTEFAVYFHSFLTFLKEKVYS